MAAALKQPESAVADEDLEYAEEWAEEIDRRMEEMRSGQVQGIPAEEAAAEIRSKYGWA
jgi:putative addiction module component (TIGR02574 family)